jgi:hypothetical protein
LEIGRDSETYGPFHSSGRKNPKRLARPKAVRHYVYCISAVSIDHGGKQFFKKSIDLVFQNMLLSALTPEHPKHHDELKNLL